MLRHASGFTLLSLALLALTGCAADSPRNPSFPLTVKQSYTDLAQMHHHPAPLKRPVVVVGGYLGSGIIPDYLAAQIRRDTGDKRVISVNCFFTANFKDCRKRLLRHVHKAFPSNDPIWSTRVDVVAFSMGGLVARDAAAPPTKDDCPQAGPKRLNIARLFTISTPNQGANLAWIPFWDPLARGMKPGSPFLKRLDRDGHRYPIYPYVVLGDGIVGPQHAAPKGQTPWWVAAPFMDISHDAAWKDPRIRADILRRLRGEQAYATVPPAPLPDSAMR